MYVLGDITRTRNVSDSRHTRPADRQTVANLGPQELKKLPPPAAHSIPQLKVPPLFLPSWKPTGGNVYWYSATSVQNLAI